MTACRNIRVLPYVELRGMYERGMTYRDIAKALGVDDASTVYTYMRREALRAGDTWPMKPPAHREMKGTVKAELMVLEIKDFCAARGVTYREFAEAVGVHPGWIYNLTSGRRTKVDPTSVKRVMNYIMKQEREAA